MFPVMTLAIVDDDDDVRTALGRLLRARGHNVRVFASAEEFESRPAPVDCLIADVRLPGLSGLELRERLRNRDTPTPVVLITGYSEQLAGDSVQSPDARSLTKPFDEDELMAAVADAIASVGGRGRQ